MANNRLAEIWNCGVPTYEAYHKFADDDALPAQPFSPPNEYKHNDNQAANIKTVVTALSDLSRTLFEVAAANNALKQWVLNEIAEMRLMAIGFTKQPTNSLTLEIIPIPLLKWEYADWKKSKFAGLGISFVDVRICPFQQFEVAVSEAKRRGRPPYKKQVWEIIDGIGLVDLQRRHSHNKTSIAAEIHKIGLMKFPNDFTDTKPDRQTIIRHYNLYYETNSSLNNQ